MGPTWYQLTVLVLLSLNLLGLIGLGIALLSIYAFCDIYFRSLQNNIFNLSREIKGDFLSHNSRMLSRSGDTTRFTGKEERNSQSSGGLSSRDPIVPL